MAAMVLPALAAGATFRPNKLGDHVPNGCSKHDCTLREAVIAANSHPGADAVLLRGGQTYNLSRVPTGTDDATTGDLNITQPLELSSSTPSRATVDANQIDRAFLVDKRATFSRLTITGGSVIGLLHGGGGILFTNLTGLRSRIVRSRIVENRAPDSFGGGIATLGAKLTITRSLVQDNRADRGGGVANFGAMRISKSSVIGNTAQGTDSGTGGGGIQNIGNEGRKLTLIGSTVSGNEALGGNNSEGGGISNVPGHGNAIASLINDTIAGNAADASGGGVYNASGVVNANAITVARNTADADANNIGVGGGLLSTLGSTFNLENSLVALNHTDTSSPDCSGLYPGGHNLVGDTTNCGGLDPNDITNVPASKIKLGQLRNNGGPTKTLALGRGSKAINHAGSDAPRRDQRGVRRHNPDIGAFERR